MTERSLHILVLTCMLPGMLTGLGADRVLCIGPDGHVALEPAMLCSQVTEASSASDLPVGGQPLQKPAFACLADCGPCTDVPGVSSLVSASRGQKASALAQPVILVTMAVSAATEMAVSDVLIGPADTLVRGCASLRTAVLLI